MKIALLPRNIGSDLNYRVAALQNSGIEAIGFNFQSSPIISNENLKELSNIRASFNPIKRIKNILKYRSELNSIIQWADIVHWVYDLNYVPLTSIPIEFDILKKYKKPGLIQWSGSDIRNFEIDIKINPYFKQIYQNGEWGYKEYPQFANRCLENFHKLNYIPLEFIGMGHYINSLKFPKRYRIYQILGTDNIIPRFPIDNIKMPLLVHSPSHRGTKGTKYILEAIQSLKLKFDFQFRLIENIPRENALNIISTCDIYIDQLIAGSHGSAAVEAMSYGKPVICYINDIIGKDYPKDLPIINANPDTIYEVLEHMLTNTKELKSVGIKSRQYAEKYHSDKLNALNMVTIYEDLLKNSNVNT